jgi:hypothetical protein
MVLDSVTCSNGSGSACLCVQRDFTLLLLSNLSRATRSVSLCLCCHFLDVVQG